MIDEKGDYHNYYGLYERTRGNYTW